jgi:hypothetical protein
MTQPQTPTYTSLDELLDDQRRAQAAQRTQQVFSLDELVAQQTAERLAYFESPEGKAAFEAAMEKGRREREREQNAPAPTPFEEGANAALRGEDREAPAELAADAQTQWLAGYDSEAEEE